MKLLTTNFLTCAVKSCKSSPASFPLHFRDAVLERTEVAYNPRLITSMLPRLNWDALRTTATELGLGAMLPETNPSEADGWEDAAAAGTQEEEREEEREEEEGDMEVENNNTGGDDDEEGVRVGVIGLGAATQAGDDKDNAAREEIAKKLHSLLLETAVTEGKLVCGNCGFEYPIKDGVGNFLLPAHLV